MRLAAHGESVNRCVHNAFLTSSARRSAIPRPIVRLRFIKQAQRLGFSLTMVRTKSGGNGAISPELVITGLIFYPSWGES
jgi:hypothetical protein